MLHVILGVCHFLFQIGRIIFELKKKEERKKKGKPLSKIQFQGKTFTYGKDQLTSQYGKDICLH